MKENNEGAGGKYFEQNNRGEEDNSIRLANSILNNSRTTR